MIIKAMVKSRSMDAIGSDTNEYSHIMGMKGHAPQSHTHA